MAFALTLGKKAFYKESLTSANNFTVSIQNTSQNTPA